MGKKNNQNNNHAMNCDCGCNDAEYDTITLTLEDDSELECGVLSIFPVQGRQYIALVPLNDEHESEEGDIYLYRFIDHGAESEDKEGEIDLINIEDDDEYELVADAFDEILDNAEFDELFDDELPDSEEE